MYWLGIDVGSISTDLILMDDDSNIIETHYLKTSGKPAAAVQEGLRLMGEKYSTDDVSGIGITGSGRHLGAAIAGADVIKNEITAHGRAVAEIDDEIRTVIEIGGQDSKIIMMKDGMVVDFAMNTVCAAGTGSFLDRQAARLGMSVETMGRMAASAGKAASIAGRCAVFAESDIIHKQQMGVKEEELMAGMCQALAAAYMSNVAKGKRLEPKICFQGGVAANLGMRKAFEDILGCRLIVPEEHKVMGAYGAALLAKEKSPGSTRFKGFETGCLDLVTKEHHCRGCSNGCQVTAIESNGETRGWFGDRCGKYSSGYGRDL